MSTTPYSSAMLNYERIHNINHEMRETWAGYHDLGLFSVSCGVIVSEERSEFQFSSSRFSSACVSFHKLV